MQQKYTKCEICRVSVSCYSRESKVF